MKNNDEMDTCMSCKLYIEDGPLRIYIVRHMKKGWPKSIPQLKLPYICWQCAEKLQKKSRHYGTISLRDFITDFKREEE